MTVMRKSVGLEILIYTLFRGDSELPFCGPKVKPDGTEKWGRGAQWAHPPPTHSELSWWLSVLYPATVAFRDLGNMHSLLWHNMNKPQRQVHGVNVGDARSLLLRAAPLLPLLQGTTTGCCFYEPLWWLCSLVASTEKLRFRCNVLHMICSIHWVWCLDPCWLALGNINIWSTKLNSYLRLFENVIPRERLSFLFIGFWKNFL